MTFLHLTLALAGFACIAIPIIIHLLMRRRRKPIMWGAMRFLMEAYRKQRRRLMLEKWLLLLTRCLLVALLAAAIGRPLLGALFGGGNGRTVYLLIDNSLASQAVGEDGRTAIDRHKQAARELLASLQTGGEGDRVALVTLGGPPEGIVLPASGDVAGVRSLLEGMIATDSRADIPGALARVGSAIESDRSGQAGAGSAGRGGGPVFVVVLSDFLEASAETSTALTKLPGNVRVLAALPGSARPNVSIVGLEPERSVVVTGKHALAATTGGNAAGGSTTQNGEQVRVMLRRSGPSVAIGETSNISVAMLTGGTSDNSQRSVPGRTQVRWAPGQEVATGIVQVRSEQGSNPPKSGASGAGVRVLEARIESTGLATGNNTERARRAGSGSDSVAGDNIWRRPVEVRDALRVGVVSPRKFGDREQVDRLDAGDWARLALRPGEESDIDVVDIDPAAIDGARLAGLDAVVLPRPDLVPDAGWKRLRLFTDGGGMVMVMPPPTSGAQLWSDVMVREFGLDWKLAREAKVFGSPEKGDAPMTIAPGTASTNIVGGLGSLLSLVRGEIDELTRPVSVWRTLPIEGETSAAGGGEGARLMSLADGSTLVWAGTPGRRKTGMAEDVVPGAAPTIPPATADRTDAPAESPKGNDRGMLIYIATALDLGWTDLPAKPLMVPLVQELVKEGVGRAHGSWWSVAGSVPEVPSRTSELRIDSDASGKNERGVSGTAPENRTASATTSGQPENEHQGLVSVNEAGLATLPLRQAGLWRAMDDRGVLRAMIAVNPDPRGGVTESNERTAVEEWLVNVTPGGKIEWLTEPDVQGNGGSGSGKPDEQPSGTEGPSISTSTALSARDNTRNISLPLLIAAMVLAVFELLLARWSSHAGVVGKGQAAGGGA